MQLLDHKFGDDGVRLKKSILRDYELLIAADVLDVVQRPPT